MSLLIAFLLYRTMVDWGAYQTAATLLLAGKSPYFAVSGTGFFNPAWAALLVAPITLLPSDWQPLAVAVASLVCVALVCRKLKMGVVMTALALCAPALWYTIGYGNIDAFVWLGLIFPAPFGLLLLALKPQATLLAMAVIVMQRPTWKSRLVAIAPLAVVGALSLAIYGWQLPHQSASYTTPLWFPYSLIVGFPLGVWAVWKRSLRWAIVAMPLCVPYLSWGSYMGLSFANPLAGWIAQAIIIGSMLLRTGIVR